MLSFRVCQFQFLWCWFFGLQGPRRFGVVYRDGNPRQEVAAATAHQQQRMRSVRHNLGLGCRNISQETLIPLDDCGEQHFLLRWFILRVGKYTKHKTSASVKWLIT